VNVEVNENVLAISGSRGADETGQAQLVERPYGSFVRTLTLPQGVNSDSIEAGYRMACSSCGSRSRPSRSRRRSRSPPERRRSRSKS
jgi:hypothetical protein